MIKILLSKKLGELRLTQADLARATGIRPNTINELYHELTERVNLEHLDLICEALNCELDELIIRVPNKETSVVHTRQGTLKPKSVCKDVVHQSDFFLCCVSVHGSKYDFVIRFDGPCREC